VCECISPSFLNFFTLANSMIVDEKPRSVKSEVVFWHKVRAQPGAHEGTKTAALQTLGVEGQFNAALQT
jgi:hypothetical protein